MLKNTILSDDPNEKWIDLGRFLVYEFINLLFIYRYASRITDSYLVVFPVYFAVTGLVFFFGRKIPLFRIRHFYGLLLFVSAVFLFFLMRQYEPGAIRVARYSALTAWIEDLLGGEFPYLSAAKPSSFPFTFVVAIPFYLLGDVGLLQILGFLLYGYVLYRKLPARDRSFRIILLLLSPVFYFEVVTRSELFTNIVFILGYLFLWEINGEKLKGWSFFLYGILGGLLLATRGIVLLAYLLFFPYYFVKNLRQGLFFGLSILMGFVLTVVPFVIWGLLMNPPFDFLKAGPLVIQSSYIPPYLLVTLIVLSLGYSIFYHSKKRVYQVIAGCCFLAVFLPFCLQVKDHGFAATLLHPEFDLSYFAFCLPFLLL